MKYFLLALTLTLLPSLASAQAQSSYTSSLDQTTNPGIAAGVSWVFIINADNATATLVAGYEGTNSDAATGTNVSGDITLPGKVTNYLGTYTVTNVDMLTRTTDGTNWGDVVNVTFPYSIVSIGDYVFANCRNLASVKFLNQDGTSNPNGWAHIQHIGQNAFNCDVTKDQTLVINGLDLSGLTDTTIGVNIFRYRQGVKGALVLPAATISVSGSAFDNTNITSVNWNQLTLLQSMGQFAFAENPSITGVDLSPCTSLKSIDAAAFAANVNMTSVVLPAGLTSIGRRTFENCNLTGDLVLPSALTTLGNQAFLNNKALRSITFTGGSLNVQTVESSGTYDGYQIFSGCTGLEYIDMATCLDIKGINPADLTTLSRSVNPTAAGHIFAGLPTHTFVYLPDNKTVFSIEAGGLWDATVSHADIPNYALGSGAWSLNIEEGVDYFFPKPFTAREIMYVGNNQNKTTPNRTPFEFTAGTTYSLYLPFEVTAGTGSLGVYSPGYYNQHNPGSATDNTFVFKKESTFAANTPYLVRVDGNAATATFPVIGSPDTQFTAVSVPASIVGVNHASVPSVNTIVGRPSIKDKNGVIWTLCGTSETVDAATAASWGAWYFANNNTWYPVSGTAGAGYSYALMQHRAFMVPSSVGAVPSKGLFGGFVDDSTNSIGGVTNDNATTTTHIYNVSGQYVGTDFNALPKGVYIVNGVKVIKK